jgi:hypothetical protein
MVQVSDNSSCEALVVMVKIEVGSNANGTCLQCQSNYCDLDKNKAYVSKLHMLVTQFWKGTTQGLVWPSVVPIDPVVSAEIFERISHNFQC